MVQLNLALREINCKVVYFGCGLGGKTTNIEVIHEKAAPDSRGELTSIATESDRTLFFDFMPLDLGTVSGMKVKFQLYTVPGQVYYNSTRKLVLRGADGVIFVADSNVAKKTENIESYQNLKDCLAEQGRSLDEMPHVVQLNKRDLPDVSSIAAMREYLALPDSVKTHEAVAARGEGVLETFKALAAVMLERVKAMSTDSTAKPGGAAQRAAAAPKPEPAPRVPTDSIKLAGGLAQPQAPAQPRKVESSTLDRRTAAARADALPPAPKPLPVAVKPAPVAKAEPPPRKESTAATAVAPAVKPSIRQPARDVPVPRSITTNKFKTIGTGSMMVSSSRRRSGANGGTIAVVIAALAAIAAGAWYFYMR